MSETRRALRWLVRALRERAWRNYPEHMKPVDLRHLPVLEGDRFTASEDEIRAAHARIKRDMAASFDIRLMGEAAERARIVSVDLVPIEDEDG